MTVSFSEAQNSSSSVELPRETRNGPKTCQMRKLRLWSLICSAYIRVSMRHDLESDLIQGICWSDSGHHGFGSFCCISVDWKTLALMSFLYVNRWIRLMATYSCLDSEVRRSTYIVSSLHTGSRSPGVSNVRDIEREQVHLSYFKRWAGPIVRRLNMRRDNVKDSEEGIFLSFRLGRTFKILAL